MKNKNVESIKMVRIHAFSVLILLIMIAGCESVTDADHTNNLQLQTSESETVTLSKAQTRVDVCHVNGKGEYNKITVADAAYETHLAHGDSEIGGDVPGMDGYIFDENCEPELDIVCPCFSKELIEGYGGGFGGAYFYWGFTEAYVSDFISFFASSTFGVTTGKSCGFTSFVTVGDNINNPDITQREEEACMAILMEYCDPVIDNCDF